MRRMVPGVVRTHLAMIAFGAFPKLLLYISLIACLFCPWKIALFGTGTLSDAIVAGPISSSSRFPIPAGAVRNRTRKCACSAVHAISRSALRLGLLARSSFAYTEFLMPMHGLSFDVSHTLAGPARAPQLQMLYQDRALFYSLSTLCAPCPRCRRFPSPGPLPRVRLHLDVTRVIALSASGHHPGALHRIVKTLGIPS